MIVVGTLRLPGTGGVRTQFGSARISTGGGATAGSAGGIAFSFGGESTEAPSGRGSRVRARPRGRPSRTAPPSSDSPCRPGPVPAGWAVLGRERDCLPIVRPALDSNRKKIEIARGDGQRPDPER